MHIFIDESGSFLPSTANPGISLVGSLIVPYSALPVLHQRYLKLRKSFPQLRGEVKGRLLSEPHIDKVVSLLYRNSAILEIVAIDLNAHTNAEIGAHRRRQAKGLISHLTDAHHPSLLKEVQDLRSRLEKMPDQLYAQSVAMFEVVANTLHHATLYYSQRCPKELSAFHWVLDAKGKDRTTNWEEWWTKVIMPALQSRSIRHPHPAFDEGDYSYFDRFRTDIPDWLPAPEDGATGGVDLCLLMMENFEFSGGATPGLEMVDIIVNAVRRAMIGHLEYGGWRNIPRLMIHTKQHYVRLIALHDRETTSRVSYAKVLDKFRDNGRAMLAPRFSR